MANTTTTSPITLSGTFKYYNNIPYDKYNRTTIDLFVPTATSPAKGIVIFHHGGGFIVGADDPVGYDSDLKASIETYIANNIAFAYVNYRLMSVDGERENLLKSLECGPKALDFIIANASAYNLDTSKICLRSSSAGNGLHMHSLHNRAVTVDCVAFNSPQITYDLLYEVIDLADWNIRTEIEDYTYSRKYYLRGAGVKNIEDLTGADWTAYKNKVHYPDITMTSSMAEAYIQTLNPALPLVNNPTNVAHHFNHCLEIQSKFENDSITCVMNLPTATPTAINASETMDEFIVRRIGL